MSRDSNASQPTQLQSSNSTSSVPPVVDGFELSSTTEDSNNNTSFVDREQATDGSAVEASSSNLSPSIREIYKNSWLKKMPCVDRWSGRFPKAQKAEKFWVVFCVHDDKEAFLEFYENRRSAYSHMPLSSIPLSNCLHISPTIVSQENDHEFVITLETQVVRLAASTNEQMIEWMDTLRAKLRELGVLEPKDNLYTKEPAISIKPVSCMGYDSGSHEDFNRLSLRDPNSPLPPVPGSSSPPSETRENSTTAVVYTRNPPILRASNTQSSSQPATSPLENSELTSETLSASSQNIPESVFDFNISSDNEQNVHQVPRRNSMVSQSSSPSVSSPSVAIEHHNSSVPSTPLLEQNTLYEPLFYSPTTVSIGIRNPNYENPPQPQPRALSNPTPALPPRQVSDQRKMSPPLANDNQNIQATARANGLSNLASTSDPSLHASSQSGVSNATSSSPTRATNFIPPLLLRTQSQLDSVRNFERTANLPLDEGPPPYNDTASNARMPQVGNILNNSSIPVDENGKPLSLREVQVQKLQSEIFHKSGVRLVLRKKDCVNAIALVECFNAVWVAGWKQKEHPLLHNTFHVGDCIISIAGHRILSVQDAQKAIKHQQSIVEFILRRVPCGMVLAIKREYEGQDLGIIREGGTAEIKEVKSNGLAARHGLPAKAPTMDASSLCNWVLTEINHRPLNLFFKDNEVQDRLNAVGLDISILVQPLDFVKSLKKQLKAIRSYKDYIVQ